MKITCKGLTGKDYIVDSDELSFRVSVYAVVIRGGEVLLVKGKTSGKYWFPGGGVDPGEEFQSALRRELSEETGVTIEIADLLHFQDEFFYHDVWQKAFHSLRFYYRCSVTRDKLKSDDAVIDGESEKPRWINLSGLTPSDFDQPYGHTILQRALANPN
jgi:8-oxo-dGTP diphosphatase